MADGPAPSLPEIARTLRDTTLTAAALTERAIARHEAVGEALGAYKLWQPAVARAAAVAADAALAAGTDLGPFHGIPISIKDLYAVDGLPTFAGSAERLPPAYEVEGPIVAGLRAQQAVVMGKTHTVEFAFGGLGTNPHWGTPRNPWDGETHRVPGGSSSGAGVSLQEGSALLALGSDTAGSVRIPASWTGTVGLKVTHGRWPLDGIVPLAPSLDTPGVLARTVEDAAYAFAAIDPAPGGAEASLRGLRLGLCESLFWEDCSPGVAEGTKAAIDALAEAGAKVVPIDIPEVEEVYRLFRRGGIAGCKFYAGLKSNLADRLDALDPMVFQRMESAAAMSAAEYLERRWLIERAAATAEDRLRTVDAVVSPTVAITPPPVEAVSTLDDYKNTNLLALRNTSIANMLRWCALTLPVALEAAGMPVGLQIMARGGQEESLLAIARAAERTLGTGAERLGAPPLCRE